MFKKSSKHALLLCMACATLATQGLAHAQAVAAPAASARPDPFVDPLDAPAALHAQVAGRPLMSIARAGSQLVGVGMRGVIALSADEGKSWTQAAAPVSSDLIAVTFPDASNGWAVGHDGVVLHSGDGGHTWMKQLDGRTAATRLIDAYNDRIAAGDTSLQQYVDQLKLDYKSGPSLPLLDVWFRDAHHGIAVGPFGIAIATDDGGTTWQPLLDHIDNPQFLHLNAIAGVDGDVLMAGERGTVFRLNPSSGRFDAIETGYNGSFFSLAAQGDERVAGGLKGVIYRSTDGGASWQRAASPLHASVTGAAWWPARNAFVFVSAAGEVALMDARSGVFRTVPTSRPALTTGVLPLTRDTLELSGLNGARAVVLH